MCLFSVPQALCVTRIEQQYYSTPWTNALSKTTWPHAPRTTEVTFDTVGCVIEKSGLTPVRRPWLTGTGLLLMIGRCVWTCVYGFSVCFHMHLSAVLSSHRKTSSDHNLFAATLHGVGHGGMGFSSTAECSSQNKTFTFFHGGSYCHQCLNIKICQAIHLL